MQVEKCAGGKNVVVLREGADGWSVSALDDGCCLVADFGLIFLWLILRVKDG